MLSRHLRALALQPAAPFSSSLPLSIFLLTTHLLALTAVARLAHWPLWSAPVLLAVLCAPQLLLKRLAVESLAPLVVVYGLAGVRLGIVYGLHQEVPARLDYGWGLVISAAWMALIYLRALRRLRYAWAVLAVASSALMAYVLYANRTAGVTGSDPYAYVQMALDLAQSGTPLHRFPLALFAARLGLPALPTTHVGYVLPNAEGVAPTVWPPGFSLFLALAYRLGGEWAMLTFNLWAGVASVALTVWLTALICPARWWRLPLFIGMGGAVLVATSPEMFTRLVVPLADGAAQALTALAVGLAIGRLTTEDRRRSVVRHPAWLGALTGLALAAAFSVRYTQILVGPGIVLMAWLGLKDAPRRRPFFIAFLLSLVIGTLPDMWYRTQLYGAPWRFGTGELALFSLDALPEALNRLRAELFSFAEFGRLWPLLVVGVVYAWRRHRFALLGLAAMYGPLIVFHLWYPFVRLRDLLSVYPPLAALCALGGAVILLFLWRRGAFVRLGVILSLFVLVMVRLNPIWLLNESGFFTFGYLRPEQRRALESLAVLTEPDAVVACSLNSGAVALYGHRETARPGTLLQPGLGWSRDEWLRFAAALQAERRPLYLLMDSPEMDEPLTALQEHYVITQIADLDVPVYYLGGGSRNLTVPLYRVAP